MSPISVFFFAFKILRKKYFIMNFLKNRYPFKLLTNFFRIAARTSQALLQNSVELKRNKSDSILNSVVKKASQTSLDKKKTSSVSLTECQNIEKTTSDHRLTSADSCSSLPYSKTSSEHSVKGVLDRKKTSVDLNSRENPNVKTRDTSLDKQLKFKLNKLQASLSSSVNSSREVLCEQGRSSLKRAYPWQNFNLNSISQEDLELPKRPALYARCYNNLAKSSSDLSMHTVSNASLTSKSSNHSLRSFNSVSSTSLSRKTSKDSLEDIKNQMPLFKSILKKYTPKSKQVKEVTFNNISTIYGPSTSYAMVKQGKDESPKGQSKSVTKNSCAHNHNDCDSMRVTQKRTPRNPAPEESSRLGRYQPLKEEHSFLHLYSGKKQKIVR